MPASITGCSIPRRSVSRVRTDATMRAFAARRARGAEVTLNVTGGDLRRFDLGRRFDLVFCVGDSTAHVHDLDGLIGHFESIGRHLRPGGLHVMETAHPADFMGPVPRTKRSWQVSRNARRLRVRWGGPADRFDPLTQLEHSTVTLTVSAGTDGAPTVVRDHLVLRRWTPDEIDAAAPASSAL